MAPGRPRGQKELGAQAAGPLIPTPTRRMARPEPAPGNGFGARRMGQRPARPSRARQGHGARGVVAGHQRPLGASRPRGAAGRAASKTDCIQCVRSQRAAIDWAGPAPARGERIGLAFHVKQQRAGGALRAQADRGLRAIHGGARARGSGAPGTRTRRGSALMAGPAVSKQRWSDRSLRRWDSALVRQPLVQSRRRDHPRAPSMSAHRRLSPSPWGQLGLLARALAGPLLSAGGGGFAATSESRPTPGRLRPSPAALECRGAGGGMRRALAFAARLLAGAIVSPARV
jgi:hypothetical protein